MMLTTTALSTTTGAAEDRVDEDGDVQTPDAIDEAFMAWYDLRAVVGDEMGGRTPPPVYADAGRDDATQGIDARRQRGLFGSAAARDKKRGGIGDDDVLPKFPIRDALTASSPTRALGEENDEWALALELAKERGKGKASRYSPFVESLYDHTPAASTRVSQKATSRLRDHAAAATLKRYEDDAIEGWKKSEKIFFCCNSKTSRIRFEKFFNESRISYSVSDNFNNLDDNFLYLLKLSLDSSFYIIIDDQKINFFSENDFFEKTSTKQTLKGISKDNIINEFTQLNLGDLVVHVDHGLGRFNGLKKKGAYLGFNWEEWIWFGLVPVLLPTILYFAIIIALYVISD